MPQLLLIGIGTDRISVEFVCTNVHTISMKIAGIEWDNGNWPKCGKHDVSKAEIEYVLQNIQFLMPDPHPDEGRYFTAGQAPTGRHVFVVLTHRQRESGLFIRPISARYMHRKEVNKYEQAKAVAKTQQ